MLLIFVKKRNTMKHLFSILCIGIICCACTVIQKNKTSDNNIDSTQTKESLQKEANLFIKNVAAMNYMEHAAVIEDTAYIGYPSRRGLSHSQDHIAATFLHDMKRGNFNHIHCCKVIDIAREHIWSDTLISGNVIGYAENEEK